LDIGGARDALADGELGTIVTESGLAAALARELERPRPNPHALARVARARFGHQNFTAGVRAAISRVLALS
jgi:hypothetical protein